MNKKLISFMGLIALATSCSTGHKNVTTKTPITRIPDKVLVESKRTETYINKEVPETPEELQATSAVKVTPALIHEYINTYKDIAMVEMQRYGIPASITLAQAILESGSGQGRLARHARNHFGIKCHYDWEGDTITHDDDAKGECFRKYEHPEASFEDHSQFLVNRSRYAFLFTLKAGDYKGWAYGLKKAGYATDPGYPQKLLLLIKKYELHQYDTEVLGYAFKEDKPLSPIPNTPPLTVEKKKEANKTVAKANTPAQKANTPATATKNTQKVVAKKDNSPKKDTSVTAQKADTTRVAQKEANNTPAEEVAMDAIKMYIVKKGDTLYSIARRSGVSVDDLMARNNMNNFNINMGQILVIRE
jgi:hemagglutinin